MEINDVVAILDKTTMPETRHTSPIQPSKKHEKAPLAAPRFKSGSVSDRDSSFKYPNFAYALTCSLKNLGDQEVLG